MTTESPQQKKKIKIAQVITRMDWGGSPDIVRILCQLLDPERFEQKLVMGMSKNLSLETRRFLDRFRDHTSAVLSLQRDINPWRDLVALIKLTRLFRRERFDIVHTHTAKAGVLGRLAAWLARVPCVVHMSHGHNFYGYFGPLGSKLVVFLEKALTLFTNRILALTELERKDLMTFKVCRPNKVTVVYSGIDLEVFQNIQVDRPKKRAEFSIRPEEFLIGMIGRLEPVKGPAYLIEAVPAVLERVPQARFLIVGEGSLRDSLELRCNQLRISDRVVFTSWREDIPEILSILDLLVLPSLNEAVGRILIEAGACGVPVIASYVGGIPEIVKDGETGILVPPRSSPDLAKAVIALAKNPGRRQAMAGAARKWVDDKFSSRRMASKIEGIYLSLMDHEKDD